MSRRGSLVLWLVAYLAVMAAIAGGLRQARQAVLVRMENPETIAAWRAWRDETRRPLEPGQPVARREVKSDEPPSLILMRDYFAAILAVSLVIGSFLFAFLGFLARGLWSQRRATPPAAGHPID